MKPKKSLTKYPSKGFGTRNLEQDLRRAQRYIAQENWPEAMRLLLELGSQFPEEKRLWQALAFASLQADDLVVFEKAGEVLATLDPTDADNLYALGGVYLAKMHPLLALQAFRRALVLQPEHAFAAEAQTTIQTLEPLLDQTLAEMGLDEANGLETAVLHEQGQAYLEQGNYAAARAAETEVARRHPEFPSAHNNLALISWLEGKTAEAIATTEALLQREPDNIHALTNIIHFWVASGDREAALPYGARLKASQADAWDGWTKKVEGLTFLADDAGIVEIFHQIEADIEDDAPINAMYYHWVAVALARTGHEIEAKAQWQKALQRDPGLQIAKDNLADRRRPVGQRHGAWPFSWEQWLQPKSAQEFRQLLDTKLSTSGAHKLVTGMKDFLSRHPDVMAMLARIAERGGPSGQEFVISTAEQVHLPALLEIVKDFALSQNGTDGMRNRAALIAAKANLLPRDKITLWLGGEWRETMLLGFEINQGPTVKHSKRVMGWVDEAVDLLRLGDAAAAVTAEALLTKALEVEPESPDLLNNLANAYLCQNRQEEAYALIREVIERFPDYGFTRAAQAKIYLGNGDLEAAEKILQPCLLRDRFQIDEFGVICDAYIELLWAKQETDGARSWMGIWEKVDPDAPRLATWQKRLGQAKPKRRLNP